MRMIGSCVVVLSGGQDSTTCLGWASTFFSDVYAITFDYGQRHRIEIEAARTVAKMAGVKEHLVVPVSSLKALGGSVMLADVAPACGQQIGSVDENNLPNTFVPGRNLLFITLAAAYAYRLRSHHIVTGVCQTDYSGYPDCRENTMRYLELTLCRGMQHDFTILAPLMHFTKGESVKLAKQIGVLHLLAASHTCYQGLRPPCGSCPACVLRAKGFAEAGIQDPLITPHQELP